jgi:hypothetical protein
MGLYGCSTQVLGSMAAAAMASSQAADSQARAEQQADAERAGDATPMLAQETQASYLQVVAELQRKSLWYAALAHLDALEQRWGVSDTSRLLRADALRQTGQFQDSERLYRTLQSGSQAARSAWPGPAGRRARAVPGGRGAAAGGTPAVADRCLAAERSGLRLAARRRPATHAFR